MSVTGRTASQSSELAERHASIPARSRYATATFPVLTSCCTGHVTRKAVGNAASADEHQAADVSALPWLA